MDLNGGFRLQDLSVQLGVACIRQALRLLQLRIGLLRLAERFVCHAAKQVPFDRKIARVGIGYARAVEQSDHVRPTPLIREDLGIKEPESDSPICVAGRKRPNSLLCILLRGSQMTAEEIAVDTLIDGCRINSRRGAAPGQGHRQERYGEDGGILPPPKEDPLTLHPSSGRAREI